MPDFWHELMGQTIWAVGSVLGMVVAVAAAGGLADWLGRDGPVTAEDVLDWRENQRS